MITIYVDEIKTALYNRCYFPALALALTLPDMCGMAEFPNEDVSKRYINWIDKYIKEEFSHKKGSIAENTPILTGEVIYNLRNTFLHQGSPNVLSEKIKEESNQVDRFILVLGDGTVLWSMALNIQSPKDKDISFKAIAVDVSYLFECICDCALWYYKENKDKFAFVFYAITQEELLNPPEEKKKDLNYSSLMAELINRKLESEGKTKKVEETDHPVKIKTEKYMITKNY